MAQILIVDDSILSRQMLSKIAGSQGHQVTTADNGRVALSILSEQKFDCMLTDILMPEMGGLELLKHVRSHYPTLPIVVISADIQNSTRVIVEEFGVSGFINKPFRPDGVLAQIDKALHVTESR